MIAAIAEKCAQLSCVHMETWHVLILKIVAIANIYKA